MKTTIDIGDLDSVSSEINHVLALFEDEYNFSLLKDAFDNEVCGSRYQNITSLMDSKLNAGWCSLTDDKTVWDASVPAGELGFGWVTGMVNEHTDGVNRGRYFQLLFLALADPLDDEKRLVNNTPVFSYYDQNGKQRTTDAAPGKSVIFNPRKYHSMTDANLQSVYVMRTVKRVPKKEISI